MHFNNHDNCQSPFKSVEKYNLGVQLVVLLSTKY